MLQAMREKMGLVMWITIIAFLGTIIFSWGMGGKFGDNDPRRENLLAVINGEKVYYDEFQNIIKQQTANNKQANQDEVQAAQMREQAWNQLVQNVIIRQQIKENKITVSAEQVYNELKTNPLPDFQSNPEFMENGTFSQAKYLQFIENPKPELKSLYIQLEEVYANWLPQKLLREKVTQGAFVGEDDVLSEYNKTAIKANVKFIQAQAAAFQPTDSVSALDIEKYFNTHLDEMPIKKEQRSFEYVLFSFEPTIRDSNMVLDDISDALKQIYNKIPFEDVAKSVSEDGSADNGGDLGYFKRGQMVPEFENAAFNAEIGAVVGPVKTQFGYHLIKVYDKKMEKDQITEVKASHILVKFKTYPSTKDDARLAAQQFKNFLNDKSSFELAAKQYAKVIKTAEPTFKGDYAQEIGQIPGLGKFLFEGKKGDISQTLTTSKGYLFARIKDIDPERKRNKDELKDMIVSKIKIEKGLEAAFAALKKLEPVIADTAAFNKIALENKMKAAYTGEVSKDGYIPGIGKDDLFSAKIFTTPVGSYSDIFKGSTAAYRVFVISRSEFDKANFESQKASIKDRLYLQQQNEIWSAWLNGLEKKAEPNIKDYRNLYFN